MDEVARVREKTDIVSLISEYIELKKTGRNFKALCPFHQEKTPSFIVSPERQIWHCFGCSKGGDVYTFLMEYENMEFPEALRTLAKKAGVELRQAFDTGLSSKKEKIYNLNKKAVAFYHYILTRHPSGKKALLYLVRERKLTPAIIETFNLGFSPNLSNALSSYLVNKKGYKKGELIEAGIAFDKDGRLFDFFRGRVMFPLSDHRGNIVGFSARTIDDTDEGSKYINTKDTIVYHKGSLFFGLDNARDEIKKTATAIVVEGEFDVISFFKAGVKNVVAIKGTALTENQATLLSRFADKVALCLDQDEAGFQALKRSLEFLEKKQLTTTVIPLANAKDPDEAIKKDPFSFKKAIKNDVGVYDFIMNRLILENNKETVDGKKKITDEILPLIAQIGNEVIKEHYLKKLSGQIDTSYESLAKEVEKIQKRGEKSEFVLPGKAQKTRREVLEEYLVSLIIQNDNPREFLERTTLILQDYEWETPSLKKIMEHLSVFLKENKDRFDQKKFTGVLAQELIKTFDTCYLFPLPKFEDVERYEQELQKVAKELRTLYIKDKIKILSQNLKAKEKGRKTGELNRLEKEFSRLVSLLPKS